MPIAETTRNPPALSAHQLGRVRVNQRNDPAAHPGPRVGFSPGYIQPAQRLVEVVKMLASAVHHLKSWSLQLRELLLHRQDARVDRQYRHAPIPDRELLLLLIEIRP